MDTDVIDQNKNGGGKGLTEQDLGPSRHQVIITDQEKNPFKCVSCPSLLTSRDLETRLQKRDETFCDDGAIARAIKTGDLKKLQWMIERGFPINLNLKDADGMCYEAVDMAEAFAHNAEVEKLVKELAGMITWCNKH